MKLQPCESLVQLYIYQLKTNSLQYQFQLFLMSSASPQDFYNQEDEGDSILKEETANSKRPSGFDPKTIIETIIQKLDRILAVVLILLLLLFFFQSSSGQFQASTITTQTLLQTTLPTVKVAEVESNQKKVEQPKIIAPVLQVSSLDDDDDVKDKQKKGETSKKQRTLKNKLKKSIEDSQESDDQDGQINKNNVGRKKLKHQEDEDSQIDSLEDDEEEDEARLKKKKKSKKIEEESDSLVDDEDDLDIISSNKNRQKDSEDSELTDSEEEDQPRKKNVKKYNKISEKMRLHQIRSDFFKTRQNVENVQYLKLAKFNMDVESNSVQEQNLFKQEQARLEKKYKLSETKDELSICAIIYSGAHKKLYGYEYALNSVLNQKYSNYIVVFIADGYSGNDVEPVKLFIKQKDINGKVSLVWNTERKYFLESTMNAINDQCSKKKITALIDGDDQLLGRQVFRLLNTHYHQKTANVIYTNFIEYHQNEMQMKLGFSNEYESIEKSDSRYRSVGQKFGSLKTFRTRLASFINEEDLKDQFQNYYRYAGDYALMYPLLELACGKIKYIPEYNYLYFGYQIDPTYGSIQISAGRQIRDKDRYSCYKNYK